MIIITAMPALVVLAVAISALRVAATGAVHDVSHLERNADPYSVCSLVVYRHTFLTYFLHITEWGELGF
jgi:hypothetical protein